MIWRWLIALFGVATLISGLVGLLQISMGRLDTARPWTRALVIGTVLVWLSCEFYNLRRRGQR